MTIQDRLKLFLQANNLSYREFEIIGGLGNGTAARIGEKTRSTILDRISNSYPNFNINWLMTGEGEMLHSSTISQSVGNNNHHLQDVNVIKTNDRTCETLLKIVEANQRSTEKFQEQTSQLIEMLKENMQIFKSLILTQK